MSRPSEEPPDSGSASPNPGDSTAKRLLFVARNHPTTGRPSRRGTTRNRGISEPTTHSCRCVAETAMASGTTARTDRDTTRRRPVPGLVARLILGWSPGWSSARASASRTSSASRARSRGSGSPTSFGSGFITGRSPSSRAAVTSGSDHRPIWPESSPMNDRADRSPDNTAPPAPKNGTHGAVDAVDIVEGDRPSTTAGTGPRR